MLAERLAQWFRIPAILVFSAVLASCGSGSGEDSVEASQEDVTASKMQLVYGEYFGDPPGGSSRPASRLAPAPFVSSNWVVDTGYGENGDGWGNDEWQRYDNSMDNLFTENGNLVIRARCSTAPACNKRDGSITSAKVTTKGRLNVRYGQIKARIKMPSGNGMWPAFWTLGSDIDANPWPDAGELDIVEMHYFYSDTKTAHFSTHYGGPRDDLPMGGCNSGTPAADPAEEEKCQTASKTLDRPLTNGFHVYEMEWNENFITGKIDGITYFRQAIDPDTMEEFLKDHYLILNVAVGGTLGGPSGPWMTANEWQDPDKTDMLVDWIEVYERVPPSKGTLIDEDGRNLPHNKIATSAGVLGPTFTGGFVEIKENSRKVPALVGDSSLEVKYGASASEEGGAPATFSFMQFPFNHIDLSDYSKLVFSMNTRDFKNLHSLDVLFADGRWIPGNALGSAVVSTSNAFVVSRKGDWATYEIPLGNFTGARMNDITVLGFYSPKDSKGKIIGGRLYLDDIRFVRQDKCKATPSIAFDSLNYKPDASVGAIDVSDVCAANSLVLVPVDNGSDEIVVSVALDAAGNGRGFFNMVKDGSVCSTDPNSSVIQLSGNLMAEYKRSKTARGGSAKAVAMAGIDPSAPDSTLSGDSAYILASDPGQALTFFPDTDYFFSDFGSGSQFNGAFSDSTYDPAFAVSDLAGQQAVLALFGFTDGFTRDAESINFKVKNLPGNVIDVKLGQDGGPEGSVTLNLDSYAGSTSIGDGWYEVSVPMEAFANPDVYDYIVFASNASSGSNFTYLITDIYLRESIGGVDAICDNVVVEGSGTGATGATGGPYSISFDNSAVSYGFVGFGNPDTISSLGTDPLDMGNNVVMTTKLSGAQVWAGVTVLTAPGITFPLTVADSKMSIRIYSPGPGVNVRMKLEESGNSANSVETEAMTTVSSGWETLTFDFNNNVSGTPALNPAFAYDKLSLFFGFGSMGDGTTYTWDTVEFLGGGVADVPGCTDPGANNYNPAATVDDGSCSYDGPQQVDLPVNFDQAGVDYSLTDFGGNASMLVTDPTDGGNTVAQTIKAGDAQLWAGTTIGADPNGFANPVPFSADDTRMTVRVYSPDAGIPVRLKVEDASNNTITVETEATTTVANAWETLTFDFANEVAGTAALNLANTYDKASIFFNFGTDGATAGEKTYLWDDVEFVSGAGGGAAVNLPVTFEMAGKDYGLTDFGGNASTIVDNPDSNGNTSGKVVQTVKAGDAQLWAGTTIAEPDGFNAAVPFTAGNTRMTVLVWSPDAGIPVRLKVEDAANNTITVETEALTTMAGAWETLTFDFANEVAGTAALNLANTYDKASIFFNFGTDGATAGEKTYYWDDVEFLPGSSDVEGCTDPTANNYNPAATVDDGSCTYDGPAQVDLPVSFEDASVDYSLTDFGGNASAVVDNPDMTGNASSKVVQTVKAGDAQLWAGTTVGADPNGFASAIPFSADDTRMTVMVWSPDAGIPVRLKVEDAANNTITVETEALTTVANAWETLTFDFANEVAGTAALNLANTYDKASIFFNFGTDGATAGEKTYFWDNVEFASGGGGGGGGNVGGGPTGDFEDSSITYVLTDFGGNATTLVADPTDSGNTVAQSVKAGNAELWAGTTFGDDMSDNGAIPFTASDTRISVRVWSPLAGIPVRLKVEKIGDPTISVETEATTTIANGWETLVFDFANEVGGTAALNLSSTYNKLSIFFNFGTDGATAGELTFLWDDVEFIGGTGGGGGGGGDPAQVDLPVTFDAPDVNYALTDFGDAFSELVADPEDGANIVVRTMKPVTAPLWAGTTIGEDPNGFANPVPFTADDTSMTVRVYSPDAGIPVRLKVEKTGDPGISVETEAVTTVANAWETLTFDFANEVAGTAALNLANTYDKASIFFNFGTDGATAGLKSYYWDDVEFVSGGGGGGGGGGALDAYIYATDPGITPDLVPASIDEFSSGSSFIVDYALDADFNPAFQVSSGTGYGVNVGFVAFNGFAAGFAKGYEKLHFKVKGLPADSTEGQPANSLEVKFFGGADNSIVYEMDSYAGATDIGNGWYDVEIPIEDFAATIDNNLGLILGPKGAWGNAFSFLLTDIGFSGTRSGGGGGGGGGGDPGDELVSNGEFEEVDALQGWLAITDPNGGSIVAQGGTVSPNNGSTVAIKVTSGPGNNPVLKQERFAIGTITPNATVTVSFDVFGSITGSGGVFIAELISEIGAGGVSKAEILSGTPLFPNAPNDWTADWVNYSFTTQVGPDVSGGLSIQFVTIGGAGTVVAHIDNVSIVLQ